MSNIYTVEQVNHYIKNMFAQDFMLNKILIRGEISNCKYHPSGHIYFSLKDGSGAIAGIMFASQRKGLAFSMKNGDKVVVSGSVAVYERDGKYQIYAREITLEGEGILYEKFLRLKTELEEMGMFAPEYKQPIPAFIRRLGVVTASSGAAVQDIINITRRRNPYVQIILYPVLVQGEESADSIVKGIRALDKLGVDTMIVGRGGGSMEDLWSFNEEAVARAIFQCQTPVISAVGHETDWTIADFVSDLRAPTPSAAAELAVYDIRELENRLLSVRKRMENVLFGKLKVEKQKIQHYHTKFSYLSPENKIREQRMRLFSMEEELHRLMEEKITDSRYTLEIYIERMKGLSPLNKLNQGFSYVEGPEGKCIRQISQVSPGDVLCIRVKDGSIYSRVEETVKE